LSAPFYIVGVEDGEGFFEQLQDFDAQYVQMAEGEPLEVVAQVEAGSADDGDGAEAGVVGAFADDVRDALVAPE
jgi:SH3-like domain-containing protein